MRKDLLSALLLFIAAYLYYRSAGDINQSALADDFGADGLPLFYAFTLGTLVLLLLGKAVLTSSIARQGDEISSAGSRAGTRYLTRAAGMLAIGVVYIVVVPVVGYWLSLLAVIALVASYQGERRDWRLVVISVGGAGIFFLFFVVLLGIDMPSGLWPALWTS